MAAISLGETSALQYSVIGQDASGIGDMKHVGMLSGDCRELLRDQEVFVFEMGPPLNLDDSARKMIAHAVGFLDVPTDGFTDVQKRIALWLAEIRTRGVRCDYRVLPATQSTIDSETRRAQYQSFSCAGFVATCYRDGAGVSLVVDEAGLPEVERALTEQIWGRQYMHCAKATRDKLMDRFGLSGPGPWQVLLPGYLLHALNQARSALPYTPGQPDWKFP